MRTDDRKTALISGSTGGIGKQVAKALASQNINVVINGRSERRGQETKAEIERSINTDAFVEFEPADITDFHEVSAMVDRAVEELGPIEIVIASGGSRAGPELDFFRNTSPDVFSEYLNHHFLSRMYLVKATLEHMIEIGGGRVIFITSDAGVVPTPGEFGPGTAAAGLILATRVLAKEFARWDITVNSVSLSFVQDSDSLEARIEESPVGEVFQGGIDQQSFPLQIENVVELVKFIATSSGAEPITGQNIRMTGGVSY